jgi:hypothetical protein
VKRFPTGLVFFLALSVLPLAQAQTEATCEEQYLAICDLIRNADEMNQTGTTAPALKKILSSRLGAAKVAGAFSGLEHQYGEFAAGLRSVGNRAAGRPKGCVHARYSNCVACR